MTTTRYLYYRIEERGRGLYSAYCGLAQHNGYATPEEYGRAHPMVHYMGCDPGEAAATMVTMALDEFSCYGYKLRFIDQT
jgi:hypothetical protein